MATLSPAPLLDVQRLAKRFGGVVASAGLDLQVREGEVHALIGPNGAGKTTLVAQLAGQLRPDSGRIVFAGTDITTLAPHERARRGLTRSFQITRLFRSFDVIGNVMLAVQAAGARSRRPEPALGSRQPEPAVSSRHHPEPAPGSRHPEQSEGSRAASRSFAALRMTAEEVLAEIGLETKASAPIDALSHGEQRALEVGLAIAGRPRLVLLDEPMAGMGHDESRRMEALIERLRRTTTLLLIEHDVDAVFRLADRVSVLVSGSIIASGAPADVRRDAAVIEAYLGEE
jgi:branched-chain amino acid transport system ATP-binding protein